VAVTLALSGCGRSIGDQCQLNTDCSPNGDRTCDLSQPGGYCTVEGCDQTSCPSDSACMRFFPVQFLSTDTKLCDPACEDAVPQTAPAVACTIADSPSAPTVCNGASTDACADDEVCIPAPDVINDASKLPGLCAPRSSERRLCVKTCGSNDDCRGGYECRPGGTKGSLPQLTNNCGNFHFCAPLVN
jgi:hypothetical protein